MVDEEREKRVLRRHLVCGDLHSSKGGKGEKGSSSSSCLRRSSFGASFSERTLCFTNLMHAINFIHLGEVLDNIIRCMFSIPSRHVWMESLGRKTAGNISPVGLHALNLLFFLSDLFGSRCGLVPPAPA